MYTLKEVNLDTSNLEHLASDREVQRNVLKVSVVEFENSQVAYAELKRASRLYGRYQTSSREGHNDIPLV